jgi:hypothetical protein
VLRTSAPLIGALGFTDMALRPSITSAATILAALLFLIASLFGLPSRVLERPPLPYVDNGACPFECCTYTQWVANEPVDAFSDPVDNPRPAFRVEKGERINAQTGFVVTKRAGEIFVERKVTLEGVYDTANPDQLNGPTIPAGELLYVLHYQGEGYSLVWYRGRTYSEMVPLRTQHHPENGAPADFPMKLKTEATADWWIQIENKQGQIGWIRNPPYFKYADACGGET